jgi:pimeloyl-ACP methyl ester carboxylesterase
MKRVQAPGGGLHVIDQPGTEPAVVLLHGFPDDSRVYDRLIPHLAPYRAVAFDFLGYGHSDQRLWLLAHTARRFGLDPLDPQGVGVLSIFPQFFGEGGTPDALAAVRAWTGALFGALTDQDARIASGQLATLAVPVLLAYGAADEYLSTGLARHLASLFGHAKLHVIEGASHWPQADQPETVARILKAAN